MELEIIHRKKGIGILSDGATVQIVVWLGSNGIECDEQDAVTAVLGPDPTGKWWSIDLRDYAPATTH